MLLSYSAEHPGERLLQWAKAEFSDSLEQFFRRTYQLSYFPHAVKRRTIPDSRRMSRDIPQHVDHTVQRVADTAANVEHVGLQPAFEQARVHLDDIPNV